MSPISRRGQNETSGVTGWQSVHFDGVEVGEHVLGEMGNRLWRERFALLRRCRRKQTRPCSAHSVGGGRGLTQGHCSTSAPLGTWSGSQSRYAYQRWLPGRFWVLPSRSTMGSEHAAALLSNPAESVASECPPAAGGSSPDGGPRSSRSPRPMETFSNSPRVRAASPSAAPESGRHAQGTNSKTLALHPPPTPSAGRNFLSQHLCHPGRSRTTVWRTSQRPDDRCCGQGPGLPIPDRLRRPGPPRPVPTPHCRSLLERLRVAGQRHFGGRQDRLRPLPSHPSLPPPPRTRPSPARRTSHEYYPLSPPTATTVGPLRRCSPRWFKT
jgi:hypothetical protein